MLFFFNIKKQTIVIVFWYPKLHSFWCFSLCQVLRLWPPGSSKKQTLCMLLSWWTRALRLRWMLRRKQVSLHCEWKRIIMQPDVCTSFSHFHFYNLIFVSVHDKSNRLPWTTAIKQRLKSSLLCCLFQESSRTSRTSLLRTRRQLLAWLICATALRLLPGHSPCQDSRIVRHTVTDWTGTGGQQPCCRNAGWAEEGERNKVIAVKCGVWMKMTKTQQFFNTFLQSLIKRSF